MPARTIKFDDFELDLARYELRRAGRAVKLEKVPMELLILLAESGGRLVTREEIVQKLWGADVFVDTRQGINTAVRKLRLALRDDPDAPRIIETVFGKGYRLAAAVATGSAASPADEGPAPQVLATACPAAGPAELSDNPNLQAPAPAGMPPPELTPPLAIGPARASAVNPRLARLLFLAIQAGYLVLYGAAFLYFPNIRRLGLPPSLLWLTLITGLVGAAVRLYLASAVALDFAGSARLFRQLFPGVLVLDALWAAAPLLLFNQLGELVLLGVAALAFLPFSQRTLMLWSYAGGAAAPAGGVASGAGGTTRLPAA